MSAAPIEPGFHEAMNRLAAALDQVFNHPGRPKEVAFILLTARVGEIDGGRVNYISNAPRDDARALMRELLARWEGRYAEEGGNA